jgi:hypothetical protein
MKTKMFVLVIVLAALVSAQTFAQNWFAGGEAALGISSIKLGGASSSIPTFVLSPLVGYRFNEKLEIGGKLYIEHGEWEGDLAGVIDVPGVVEYTTFGVAPSVWYSLYTWDRLELLVRGSVIFTLTSHDFSGVDDIKELGLVAAPLVRYTLKDWLAVYAEFGEAGITRIWADDDNSVLWIGADIFSEPITLGFVIRF